MGIQYMKEHIRKKGDFDKMQVEDELANQEHHRKMSGQLDAQQRAF
jgi:hypothetical protein